MASCTCDSRTYRGQSPLAQSPSKVHAMYVSTAHVRDTPSPTPLDLKTSTTATVHETPPQEHVHGMPLRFRRPSHPIPHPLDHDDVRHARSMFKECPFGAHLQATTIPHPLGKSKLLSNSHSCQKPAKASSMNVPSAQRPRHPVQCPVGERASKTTTVRKPPPAKACSRKVPSVSTSKTPRPTPP